MTIPLLFPIAVPAMKGSYNFVIIEYKYTIFFPSIYIFVAFSFDNNVILKYSGLFREPL